MQKAPTIDSSDSWAFYTFSTGTTYWISEDFYPNEAIFYNGAVLKFYGSASIVNWGAAPFYFSVSGQPAEPVIFTSMNDNNFGETIAYSSGNPTTSGADYLEDGVFLNTSGLIIEHARFLYAGTAYEDDNDLSIFNDCQFLHCGEAAYVPNDTAVSLQDVLFSSGFGVEAADYAALNIDGEQVTADSCRALTDDGYGIGGGFTNSIFTACDGSEASCTEDHTLDVGSATGIYAAGGSNLYYLAAGSTNRDAGSTTINTGLRSQLEQMTTYAPQNGSIADTTTYHDKGYHYPIPATFYVATSGNDTHNGLTPATAWATLHYALTNAAFTNALFPTTLVQTPVMLELTSGEVFTETNAALYVSGTAAAPIVVTTTGSSPAIISNYLSCPWGDPAASNVANTLSLVTIIRSWRMSPVVSRCIEATWARKMMGAI